MTAKAPELPTFIEPMLSRPGEPFDADDYFFEIKWDGTRALAFIDHNGYRLVNRRQAEMTVRYPEFAFLAGWPAGTILDAEMVVLKDGKPDFALLQSRDHARSAMKIRMLAQSTPATLIVFDLLYEDYTSLLEEPFTVRRERLRRLVFKRGRGRVVLSEGVVGTGKAFFREACRLGLEGMVAKRLSSPYMPGRRSDAWVKVKRGETIECLVIGFIPTGKDDFRSLMLAAQDNGAWRYVGKVGTGFDMAMRDKLNRLLRLRPRRRPVVPCPIKGQWIEPGLYCRVSCMERTPGGELRAPVFEELTRE